MANELTTADLKALGRSAKVKLDPESREIAQFGDLIEQVKLLLSANAERTRADLERSQVQLEVLATLQKLVRANGTKSHVSHETINLDPLKDVLLQIHAAGERAPLAYRFDIHRGEGGYMAGVTATPVAQTKH